MRTEELRENLNVQVSAAAVVVDKGEAAKKLNEALSKGPGKKEAPPPGANQIIASGRKLTAAQQAEIAASMAATKTLRE